MSGRGAGERWHAARAAQGDCIMAVLFHHVVGAPSSHRLHRRFARGGRRRQKPPRNLCNSRNSRPLSIIHPARYAARTLPRCARGLGHGSAQRAHAGICNSAGLNPLSCSCARLLPRGSLRTTLGPSALSLPCSSSSAGTVRKQSSRRDS